MTKLTEGMVLARSKGSDLDSVKKLNCWGSELDDVSLLRKLSNVEVLSLSVNNISTLYDFQFCKNLQELYVRKNKITHLEDIMYIKDLARLKSLWLADNPCAERERYRLTVLRYLPKLEKLDNVSVERDETEAAQQYGLTLVHPSDMDQQEEMVEEEEEEIDECLTNDLNQSPVEGGMMSVQSPQEAPPPPRPPDTHVVASAVVRPMETRQEYDHHTQSLPPSRKPSRAESVYSDTRSEGGMVRRPSQLEISSREQSIEREIAASTPTPTATTPLLPPHRRDSYDMTWVEQNLPRRIPNGSIHDIPNMDYRNGSRGYAGALFGGGRESFDYSSQAADNPHCPVHHSAYSQAEDNRMHRTSQSAPPGEGGNWRQVAFHYENAYHQVSQQLEAIQRANRERVSPQRPQRPRHRLLSNLPYSAQTSNLLSAALCLVRELDVPSLEVLEMAVRCRMEEIEQSPQQPMYSQYPQ